MTEQEASCTLTCAVLFKNQMPMAWCPLCQFVLFSSFFSPRTGASLTFLTCAGLLLFPGEQGTLWMFHIGQPWVLQASLVTASCALHSYSPIAVGAWCCQTRNQEDWGERGECSLSNLPCSLLCLSLGKYWRWMAAVLNSHFFCFLLVKQTLEKKTLKKITKGKYNRASQKLFCNFMSALQPWCWVQLINSYQQMYW